MLYRRWCSSGLWARFRPPISSRIRADRNFNTNQTPPVLRQELQTSLESGEEPKITKPSELALRNDMNSWQNFEDNFELASSLAVNQLDSLKLNQILRGKESGLTATQSKSVVNLLLGMLNKEFFSRYNWEYLRKSDLNKQSHLFNSLEAEVGYIVQVSRSTQLNEHKLEIMKLVNDLDSLNNECNELIIELLHKDAKLSFNNHKLENTLLLKDVDSKLNDCTHKITTKLLSFGKSEIEKLRWQTTRNGLLAILLLVFGVLFGVKMSKNVPYATESKSIPIMNNENSEEQVAEAAQDDAI